MDYSRGENNIKNRFYSIMKKNKELILLEMSQNRVFKNQNCKETFEKTIKSNESDDTLNLLIDLAIKTYDIKNEVVKGKSHLQ